MIIKQILNYIKQVENNLTSKNPIILYEGETSNTVTLNDSIVNYEIIKVYYRDTDGFQNMIEIYNNFGTMRRFAPETHNNTGTLYIKTARCTLKEDILTIDRKYQAELRTSGNAVTMNQGDFILITRIEGYK